MKPKKRAQKRSAKPLARGLIPVSKFANYLPRDPAEIDRAIFELRRELDPEMRREIAAGRVRSYGWAAQLQGALVLRATARMEQLAAMGLGDSWPPESILDWETLARASDGHAAALGRSWCCLSRLGELGREPSEADRDLERLRVGLIEIAHWVLSEESEQEDEQANHGARFSRGRKKGALSPVNALILRALQRHPQASTKAIAAAIEEDVLTAFEGCPLEVDAGRLVERATGRELAPESLRQRIDDVRRRHFRHEASESQD